MFWGGGEDIYHTESRERHFLWKWTSEHIYIYYLNFNIYGFGQTEGLDFLNGPYS